MKLAPILIACLMAGCISSGGGPQDGFTVNPKQYDRQVRAAFRHSKNVLAANGYKCSGYGTLALASIKAGTHFVGGYWVVYVNGMPCRHYIVEPKGWANRRQIVCVVPPPGEHNAGVLADRIPGHEVCHILLDACGITDTAEQHRIMKRLGLY